MSGRGIRDRNRRRRGRPCCHQARRLSRRQPIAAGLAPRPLSIPDDGCARRSTLWPPGLCRGRAGSAIHAVERLRTLHSAAGRQRFAAGLFGASGLLWTGFRLRLPGPLLRRALCRLLESPALRLRRLRILLAAISPTTETDFLDVAGPPRKNKSTDSARAITADLVAVLVAVTDGEPKIMTIANATALPSGPFEFKHRSLQSGLRAWVEAQTGHPLGYVEQLYTFADAGRSGGADSPHSVSISYLGLTREDQVGRGFEVHWSGWY